MPPKNQTPAKKSANQPSIATFFQQKKPGTALEPALPKVSVVPNKLQTPPKNTPTNKQIQKQSSNKKNTKTVETISGDEVEFLDSSEPLKKLQISEKVKPKQNKKRLVKKADKMKDFQEEEVKPIKVRPKRHVQETESEDYLSSSESEIDEVLEKDGRFQMQDEQQIVQRSIDDAFKQSKVGGRPNQLNIQKQEEVKQKENIQLSMLQLRQQKAAQTRQQNLQMEEEGFEDIQDLQYVKKSKAIDSEPPKPNKPVKDNKNTQEKAPAKELPAKEPPAKKIQKPQVTPSNITGQCFEGVNVSITGDSALINRENLEKIIKENGGKVTGSVSGKTTYLIACGDEAKAGFGQNSGLRQSITETSKYKEAVKRGVKIISDIDFDQIVISLLGKPLSGFFSSADPQQLIEKMNESAKQEELKTMKSLNPKALQPKMKIIEEAIIEEKLVPKSESKPQPTPSKAAPSNQLWTVSHAPQTIADCVGNSDNIAKIVQWLLDYEDVVIKKMKVNTVTTHWGSGQFPSKLDPNKRAVLVSGPPGIGKTTAIRLIAKQMKYDLIEQNASDVRSKNALKDMLQSLTDNSLISADKQRDVSFKKKFIILMDEVDGCSAGDRGGISQLIQIIKDSKTPIICICNDRQHQKVRSLANHCYDIEFQKPHKQTISQRISNIAKQEGLYVDQNTIDQLCEGSGYDIRQILNALQMFNCKSNKLNNMDFQKDKSKKDDQVMMTNFQAASTLMTRSKYNSMQLFQRIDLFFVDHEFIPLIIQNQYLDSIPKIASYSIGDLECIAYAAESIANSDIISKSIRTNGNWNLLPQFAFASSIYPCQLVCVNGQASKFPTWMAKNSSQKKVYRLIREFRQFLGHAVTGSRYAIKFDYAKPLRDLIVFHSKEDRIDEALEVMKYYNITPDILKEHLASAQSLPVGVDPFADISTGQKSALTRAYNKKNMETKMKKRTQTKDNKDTLGQFDELNEEEYHSQNEENFDEEEDDYNSEGEEKKPAKVIPKGKAATKQPAGKKAASNNSMSKKYGSK